MIRVIKNNSKNYDSEVEKDLFSKNGDTGPLSKEDTIQVNDSIENIKNSLSYKISTKTDTEIRLLILNDEIYPNDSSKYFQSLKELSSRVDKRKRLSFDYKENLIMEKSILNEIEYLNIQLDKLQSTDGNLITDKIEFDIKQLINKIESNKNNLNKILYNRYLITTERNGINYEITILNTIINELKPRLQGLNISITDPDEYQLIYTFKEYLNSIIVNSRDKDAYKYNIINYFNKIKERNYEESLFNILSDEAKSIIINCIK